MHLNIVDHHTPPTVKLMNSGIVGLSDNTAIAIQLLIKNFRSKYSDVNIEEFLHKRTIEGIKQKYSKNHKFYYPKSLYVTVTVHSARQNHMTLDLNKDNIHGLNIYTANVQTLTLNDFNHITEYLYKSIKRYKYLL